MCNIYNDATALNTVNLDNPNFHSVGPLDVVALYTIQALLLFCRKLLSQQ